MKSSGFDFEPGRFFEAGGDFLRPRAQQQERRVSTMNFG
jgi:hypothetical protein